MKKTEVELLALALPPEQHGPFVKWIDFRLADETERVKMTLMFQGILTGASREEMLKNHYGQAYTETGTKRGYNLQSAKLAEELRYYMAYAALAENREQKELFFLEYLKKYASKETFTKFWRKVKNKLLPKSRPQTAHYHKTHYQLLTDHYSFAVTEGKNRDTEIIKDVFRSFDRFWMFEKLFLILATLSVNRLELRSSKVHKKKIAIEMYEQEKFLDDLDLYARRTQSQSIIFLIDLIRQLKNQTLDLETVLSQLSHEDKIKNSFEREDLSNIFTSILNFLNHDRNKFPHTEHHHTNNKRAQLYEWGLNQKLFHENGKLRPHHYNNIVAAMVFAKNYERADYWAEKLKNQLSKNVRDDLYTLKKAQILFHQQRFEGCRKMLKKIKSKAPFYQIRVRLLNFLLDYNMTELHLSQQQEDLKKAIHTFYEFVRKQEGKVPSSNIKPYLDQSSWVKKLLKANDLKSLLDLQQEIQQTEKVIYPDWLLFKIHEKITYFKNVP